MNKTLRRIAVQREHMVAQAASQRGTLAQNVEPWRLPLALADQAISVLHYLKRHPGGIAGVAVLFIALRPGGIAAWLGRGVVSWRLIQGLRSK